MVLTFLLVRLLSQLSRVQQEYQQMVIFESAYWSLQETIQEAEAEGEEALGETVPTLKQGIRLDGVSFAYGEQVVLKDVTLEFPAGRITSIVGPSGSGKTTVANLVTGLARPKKGEIWIDGLPMSDIHLRSWRHMIGYVPQETLLLHESVIINVTLGDPELKEKDAEQALRAAGAWEFVEAMPEGIQTVVGERGGRLSGGQRQRIAIARALVHKPAFLILDEATSALDHENELAICETLKQLRGKITILAISHRAVLIKMADRAYGLEDGRVVHTESSSKDGGDLQGPDQGMAVAWRPQ
jgi:ATP-binding cassette subfamily C protein